MTTSHCATYRAELAKLDTLEQTYWQRWEACDQAEPRNESYLRGIRWCMSHRLKLLSKLEKMEKLESPEAPPAASTSPTTAAPSTETAPATAQRRAKPAKPLQQQAREIKRATLPAQTSCQALISKALSGGVDIRSVLLPKGEGKVLPVRPGTRIPGLP